MASQRTDAVTRLAAGAVRAFSDQLQAVQKSMKVVRGGPYARISPNA